MVDRGQLLLVGAVTVGIAILGSVVVLNDLPVNNTMGATSEAEALSEAERVRWSVRRDLAALVSRVLASDPANYHTEFRQAVDDYEASRNSLSTQRDGTYVAIEIDGPASHGAHIDDATTFGNGNHWPVATGVSTLGSFDMTIRNIANNPVSDFTVRIDDGPGPSWEMTVTKSGGTLTVETDGPSGTETCSGLTPPVDIDITRGTIEGSSGTNCEFTSPTETVDTPLDIEFANGNQVNDGQYDLKVAGATVPHLGTSPYWVVVAVDVTYQSPTVRDTWHFTVHAREGSI